MTFLKATALTLATSLLLWSQVGFTRREGIQNLPGSSWRFWDDMTLAIARYVDASSHQPPLEREEDGPRDGESRRAPLFHYKYSTPIDWFGWKDHLFEVPISTLYIPTLLLLLWGRFAPGRIHGEAGVLGAIAAAALPVPLLISTASGLETQGFGLVYFLGAAFLAQRVADTLMLRFKRA